MDLHRPHLIPWFYALLLLGAAAWPVSAQESMVFSKPADLPTDKANSFMGDEHRKPGALNSPAPLFGKPQADFDILPGVSQVKPPSADEVRKWQKFLDERKNWTLMTPEQILGVPTPEQILGLPDPNHEENLSAEERYINRQERERSFSATNAVRQGESLWGQDASPFRSQNSDSQRYSDSQKFRQDSHSGMTSPNYSGLRMNGTFSPAADPRRSSDSPDSIWHSAFAVAPAAPKPDLEQVAAMERFRAMMDPAPAEKHAPVTGYSTTPVPAPDPYLQPMPAFNPAGHSYAPVQNTAGRPMGINPLPTITGQTPNQTPPKPKPMVKLPPWLSNEPQLGKPQQREF